MNLKTIGEIILFLWNTGILTAVAYAASRFFIAHTKNKNLLLLEQWALQATQYAETHMQGSDKKKQVALTFLADRLNANRLGFKFDAKQLDTAIETAVTKMKGITNE